jgi:hypothetical protein
MSTSSSNMPHLFIEEMRPRDYLRQTGDQEYQDGNSNDQTRSSLQEYVDNQPNFTEDELRQIATRFQSGETSAAELIDRSLKLIRHVVRRFNLVLHLDEDELIGMVVEDILARSQYLIADSEEKITTRIGHLSEWALFRNLPDYLRNTTMTNNAYWGLQTIRGQVNKMPGDIFEGEDAYEITSEVINNQAIGHDYLKPEVGAQTLRLIGALPLNGSSRSVELPSGDPEERIALIDLKVSFQSLEKIADGKANTARGKRVIFLHLLKQETLHEIGEKEGLTRSRIGAIEAEALKKLAVSEA